MWIHVPLVECGNQQFAMTVAHIVNQASLWKGGCKHSFSYYEYNTGIVLSENRNYTIILWDTITTLYI